MRDEYINLLKNAFMWCCSLEDVWEETAYILLSNDDMQINEEMIAVLPELIEKRKYKRVIFISDKSTFNEQYKTVNVTTGLRQSIIVLQRSFHPFSNIYVNESKDYDDNDFTCFINEKDVDLKYIIRNVFFDLSNPSKKKPIYIDNNKKWNEIYEKIMIYKEAYDGIRERFPLGKLFIHPFASGDMYVSCLYLEEYIENNGIKEYNVLVSNKGAQKVGELFGIESHIVDKEKLIQAILYQRVFGKEIANIKNTHMCVGSQRGSIFLHKIDYNTYEQKWVYQAEERNNCQQLIQRDSDYVFNKYNLIPEKTVVVSPFSHSVCPIEEDLYSDIVNYLHNRNYQVCTNIGFEEEELPGTIGVNLPYDIVVDFVNKSAGFIGMRSGLCDIISTTTSKMVVFHQENSFNQFSLKKMGLKTDNILELCVDKLDSRLITTSTVDFLTKNK